MRASLLTGQHPLSHGIIANDILMREDVPCIAKSLKSHGYDTGYIGKWHLDLPDRTCFTPPGPRRQGFDFWAAHNCNHYYYESYYYRDDPEPIWIDGYQPDTETDIAIDCLQDSTRRDKPFCLFLSWSPPHCPYDHVPRRFLDMYPSDKLPFRPNVVDPMPEKIAGYYAHITALDWNFGRLMAALEDSGLVESTLVIFTSDHGDMLFSQNRGWKCKPWAESVNVPLIARWPGRIPAGAAEHAPFGLVNTMPTLLSICGADIPVEADGEAYPQMLLGQDGPRPESTPIYHFLNVTRAQSIPEWRGVVTGRHTYARFREESFVLYDDLADPYQMNNLAGEPRLIAQMEEHLGGWMERLNDDFDTQDELRRRFNLAPAEDGVMPYTFQPHMLEEMKRRADSREERMRK